MHGWDPQKQQTRTNQLPVFRIEKIVAKKYKAKLSLHYYRAHLIDWVDSVFSEKLSAYYLSLFLGFRSNSFEEIRETFDSTGMMALFSLSGMYLYTFYGLMYQGMRRTRMVFNEYQFILLPMILSAIFLFGATVSVWRATLMFLLGISLKQYRLYLSPMDRFSIVLCLLMLINPWMVTQVSGVLSLGISLIALFLQSSGPKKNARVVQAFIITLAISPLLAYFFYEIPFLGGAATFLYFLLFVGLLVPGGIGMLFVNLLGYKGHLVDKSLTFLIEKMEWCASFFKEFTLITGKPPWVMVVLVIILGLYFFQKRNYLFLLLLYLVLVFSPRWFIASSVTFVDVGQGDSIVVQTKGNKEVYVIDTGGKVNFGMPEWKKRIEKSQADYTLLPFLKGEGVREIHGLFLTHADADHMGDALRLVNKIPVRTIYVGKGMLALDQFQVLKRQLPKRTSIKEVNPGDVFGRNVQLTVLGPEHKGEGKNEDSIVIHVQMKETSFLLTGDLGKAGERELINRYPNLQADVLKVGHHGSKNSTDAFFVEKINARKAVISCGIKNRYGHPHPEILDTLASHHISILRTDQHGMIRFKFRRNQKTPHVFVMKED